MKGSVSGLFLGTVQESAWGTEEKHERPQSRYVVSRQRFETGTSRIQSRDVRYFP
jgi:hypothetical protein